MEVVDSPKPDEDLVGYPSPSARAALWGGLLSTAVRLTVPLGWSSRAWLAMRHRSPGWRFLCLLVASRRWTRKTGWAFSSTAAPSNVGGVLVEPSDIVFGDADGVVMIPQDVAAKTVNAALKRTAAEHLTETEEELKKGTLLREATRNMGCCDRRSHHARPVVNKIADADGTKKSRDICWPSR